MRGSNQRDKLLSTSNAMDKLKIQIEGAFAVRVFCEWECFSRFQMLKSALFAKRFQGARRSFAVAKESALTYSREGDQPLVAPAAVKLVSKASNGVSIATYDHGGPTSALAIYINAGSKFDSVDAPGVAQLTQRSLVRVQFRNTGTSRRQYCPLLP